MTALRVAILTVSDRCARGEAEDASGPALAELVGAQLAAEVVASALVADDRAAIADWIGVWARESPRPDLILTTGGTGLGPRDVTPEATADVLERRLPALLELARLRCLERTPRAFLSRGEAGALGSSLVINLPGSPRGATETLAAILDLIPHAVAMLHGGDHPR